MVSATAQKRSRPDIICWTCCDEMETKQDDEGATIEEATQNIFGIFVGLSFYIVALFPVRVCVCAVCCLLTLHILFLCVCVCDLSFYIVALFPVCVCVCC